MEPKAKACAVLVINIERRRLAAVEDLSRAGFTVHETTVWPDDAAVKKVEAVIVLRSQLDGTSMLAARLRAKPHFGRRVLIALVPAATTLPERRAAESSGFDDVLDDTCEPRLFLARLTRRMRARPELRCVRPRRRGRAA